MEQRTEVQRLEGLIRDLQTAKDLSKGLLKAGYPNEAYLALREAERAFNEATVLPKQLRLF